MRRRHPIQGPWDIGRTERAWLFAGLVAGLPAMALVAAAGWWPFT